MPVTLEMLIAFVGRTHPLALHLPIGLFAALAALEALAWLQGRRLESHVRTSLAAVLVLTCAWSVVSGLLLGSEPGYSGTTLDRHKVAGIAFGAGTILLLWAAAAGRAGAYRGLFVVCALAMVVSGHLGATITHGEDFLTEPFKAARTGVGEHRREADGSPSVAVPATRAATGAARFREQVMPVLATTCVSCHNAAKAKGGLALHDIEAIRRGGDTGPAVVPGDPAASELLVRMRLPLDDDDHMPPKNKPQPTEAQVALVEAWILEGAPMDDATGEQLPQAEPSTGSNPTPVLREGAIVPPASPEAVAALRDALLHVEPLEPGSTLLSISTGGADGLEASRLVALLGPVTPQIGALDLSRMTLDDEVMRRIAAMMSLRRLNVSRTSFGDEQVAIIAPTVRLETLVAVQTRLSPRSVELLRSIASLRAVYAWRTGLTAEAVGPLAAGGVRVDLGEPPAREPLETEAPPTLASNPTTAPGGLAGSGGATAIVPINATCPVAGKPVNPDVIVVYKGRAIGFCCTACAGTFLADPAAHDAKVR